MRLENTLKKFIFYHNIIPKELKNYNMLILNILIINPIAIYYSYFNEQHTYLYFYISSFFALILFIIIVSYYLFNNLAEVQEESYKLLYNNKYIELLVYIYIYIPMISLWGNNFIGILYSTPLTVICWVLFFKNTPSCNFFFQIFTFFILFVYFLSFLIYILRFIDRNIYWNFFSFIFSYWFNFLVYWPYIQKGSRVAVKSAIIAPWVIAGLTGAETLNFEINKQCDAEVSIYWK